MALVSGQGSAVAVLPLLAAPLAVVGLLDDRHNLPASWRYGVQLLTAAFMLGFSPLFNYSVFPDFLSWLLCLPSLVRDRSHRRDQFH